LVDFEGPLSARSGHLPVWLFQLNLDEMYGVGGLEFTGWSQRQDVSMAAEMRHSVTIATLQQIDLIAMSEHKRRFKRWHASKSSKMKYLVDLILAEIVPCFEREGFQWYPDFAGGDIQQVANSCIPLQRRDGRFWPTVEIAFDRRDRPTFYLNFAMLPPNCRRWTKDGWVDVTQSEAALVDGPAVYFVCGTNRWSRNGFGYLYFSLVPKRRLRKDVAALAKLLPELFRVFESGELEMKTDAPDPSSAFRLLTVIPGKYG
jgi:hypothetical protein